MNTRKILRVLYIATYVGIIVLAVTRIVDKVRSAEPPRKKRWRPLFESRENPVSGQELNESNCGFARNRLDMFVGKPSLGKEMMKAIASVKGRTFWDDSCDKSEKPKTAERSKEVTLDRHRELEQIMQNYADEQRSEDRARRIVETGEGEDA